MLNTRFRVVLEEEEVDETEDVVVEDEKVAAEEAFEGRRPLSRVTFTLSAAKPPLPPPPPPPDSDGTCFRFSLIVDRLSFVRSPPPSKADATADAPECTPPPPPDVDVVVVPLLVIFRSTPESRRRTMRFLHLEILCRSSPHKLVPE